MTRLRITPDGEIVRPSLCEASMGLGLGLYLGSGGAAVASTPTGTPTALTIADATAIDTYWFMNGAAATVRYKGLATGGTADASKLTITVTRPGYDDTGAATNYSVSVDGQVALRRAGSNATSKVQITAGSDVDIVYVPKRRIFASETCAAALLASAYTSSLAGNPTVTNNSTLAYPKPAVQVLHPPHLTVRADSSGAFAWNGSNSLRTGEIVCISPHAQQGRPVACVKVRTIDAAYLNSSGASGHATSWTTITTMARATWGTAQGLQTDCFPYSIDISALDHGDCYDEIEVYPWWGDSSSVFKSVTDGDALITTTIDTSTNVTAQPYMNVPNRLPFFYNKNNEPEIFVNVDPATGSDTVTAAAGVSTSQAGCDALGAPCATIGYAASILQSFNNTNYSRNNLQNACITVRAGTHYGVGPTSMMSATRTYGSGFLVIRRHPSDGVNSAIFRSLQADNTTAVTSKKYGNRTLFNNISWEGAQAAVSDSNCYLDANTFTNGALDHVHIGGRFVNTATKAGTKTNLWYANQLNWVYDATFTNTLVNGGANYVLQCAVHGCYSSGANIGSTFVTGCDVLNASITGDVQTGSAANNTLYWQPRDVILTSNRVMWENTITGSGLQLMESATSSGIALPSNSYSWTHSQMSVHYTGGSTIKCMQFSADGQERTFAAPAWGLIGWSTNMGERTNVAYNQSPSTSYAEKNFYIIGLVADTLNMKSDTETTVSANRTGNALPRHYVDCYGNAVIGNAGANQTPGVADTFIGETFDVLASYGAGTMGFTSDTSRTGTGTNVLPDPRPAAGSRMLGCIAAGSQPSKNYLGGAARDNSSAGPAGCREAA